MKTLILLRGLPGAGKTTFAKYMFSNNVFEADQYFYDEQGNYNFDGSALSEAHEWCKSQVEDLMKMSDDTQYGQEIVVSNTNTTEAELAHYIKLGEKYNYQIVSLIVENRHGNKSVHNVPDAAMEKMRKRFEIKL